MLPTQWNHKRCQIPFPPQSAPHPRHWGSQVQGQRGKGEWVLQCGPDLGQKESRASAGWADAQGFALVRVPGSLKTPFPNPSGLRLGVPLRNTLRLEGRLPVGRTHSPRPTWQPAAWAGPQQNQTHRGPHRRGVAADWRRAAHSDQGHGAKPGAPGLAPGTEPSHSHTDSPCPAGPGRKDGAWHLLGGGP